MLFSILLPLIVASTNSQYAPDVSIMPLPYLLTSYTLDTSVSFNATSASSTSYSTALSAVITSNRIQLNSKVGGLEQGGAHVALSLPTNWRLEAEVETNYDNVSGCGLFAIAITGTTFAIETNNSMDAGAGDYFWWELCPTGSSWHTSFTTTTFLQYPNSSMTGLGCDKCGNVLPPIGFGRFSVAIQYTYNAYNDYKTNVALKVLNNPLITETFHCHTSINITTVGTRLRLIGLSGTKGDATVNRLSFWSLSSAPNSYSANIERPPLYAQTLLSNHSFSSASATVASTWIVQNSVAFTSSDFSVSTMRLGTTSENSIGHLIAPQYLPPYAYNLRIEMMVRNWDDNQWAFGMKNYITIQDSANPPLLELGLNNSRGLTVGIWKSTHLIYSPFAYFSPTLTAVPFISSLVPHCSSCLIQAIVTTETPIAIIVEIYNETLTATFQTMTTDSSISFPCYQRYPIPGFQALVESGTAQIGVHALNNDGSNSAVTGIESFNVYFTDFETTTTPTTSTTTTSTTTTPEPTSSSTTEPTTSSSTTTLPTTSTTTEPTTSSSTTTLPTTSTTTEPTTSSSTTTVPTTSTTTEPTTSSSTTTVPTTISTSSTTDSTSTSSATSTNAGTTPITSTSTTTTTASIITTALSTSTSTKTSTSSTTAPQTSITTIATSEPTTTRPTSTTMEPKTTDSASTTASATSTASESTTVTSTTSTDTSTDNAHNTTAEWVTIDEKPFAEAQTSWTFDDYYNHPAVAPYSIKTGFPIPVLAGSNLPVPAVGVPDLVPCPYIAPNIRSPKNSTQLYMILSLERIMESDDVSRTLTMWGSVLLQWKVDNCPEDTVAPYVDIRESVYAGDAVDAFWKPKMIFLNATEDLNLASDDIANLIHVMYVPTTPNRTLYFYWNRVGILKTKCSYDLKSYPFDVLECDFTFGLEEPYKFALFSGVYLNLAFKHLNNSEQWSLTGFEKNVYKSDSIIYRGDHSSFVRASLQFRRNPTYYIANLLAPCLVLIVLIFVSFFAPSNIDRAAFTGTILLSVMVTQTTILQEVPQTSQGILFADYIQLLTGLGGFVTLYHLAMCAMSDERAEQHLDFSQMSCMARMLQKFSIGRAIDLAAFLLSMAFFLCFNIWASLSAF